VGHKVHPNAFRLGIYRGWEANWFAPKKEYRKLLHEDLEMRRLILGRLRNAGIAKIETERSSNAQMTVTIHTAKPGIVIGKGGASVDQLREDLEKKFGNRVRISIQEIKQQELDAQLVAENIASQIERRISYRRAMKQSILRTMRAGARGVRIGMAGRLRGSEMARREWDREGRVPLHTLRADIDFGRATAKTTFGAIGVKAWIYKDTIAPQQRRGGAAGDGESAIAPQPEAPESIPEPQVAPAAQAVQPAQTATAATAAEPAVTAEPATEAAPARRPRTTTSRPRTTAAPQAGDEQKPAAAPRPRAAAKPKAAEGEGEAKKPSTRKKAE
jgi:small subunit ribosomal protein S3